MKYTRIYADADGESHFEDLELALTSTNFVPPAPPVDISTPVQAATVAFVRLPPGWVDVTHPVPRRQFITMLAGALDVTTSDRETRHFQVGDVMLVEDTIGKGHFGRVTGAGDVLLQIVALPD